MYRKSSPGSARRRSEASGSHQSASPYVRWSLLVTFVGILAILVMAGQSVFGTQAPPQDELSRLDDEGRLTVRALMGWGALPNRFKPLIFEMRAQGHDLLGADAAMILSWLRQDGLEQTFTPEQRTALRELATFMVGRNYLEQSRSEQKKEISADELRQPRDAPPVPAEPQETAPPQAAENLTLAGKVFDLVAPSTVVVVAHDTRGEPFGQGSGVTFASNVVATNCHTLEEARSVSVHVEDRKYPATILHSDWERDVCSLSVPGLQAEPVRHGSTAALRVGSRVYAVGAPKGLELTLSEGIVSSLRDIEGGRYIQTTAPISPGSSGGGLYDHQGRLVGLTTFLLKDSQNLNFALPVEWIHELPGRHTARQSSPEDDVAWIEQAIALEQDRDWSGLIRHSLAWVRAEPGNPVAWFCLGIGHKGAKQWPRAIEAFQRSLRIDQDNDAVWFNLGYAYIQDDQPGRAVEAFEQVVRIDPDDEFAWYYMGLSYLDLRNPKMAAKALSEALRINPKCPYNWYFFGISFYLLDEIARVNEVYQKIRTLDKDVAEEFFQKYILP